MSKERLVPLVAIEQAQAMLAPVHKSFDQVSEVCTARILDAFRKYRVSDAHFAGTTGYGYNDIGRDTLESIMAEVMGGEAALMRVQFVSGTHTIACALFGVLRPGDTLLSATGTPYDTLQGVIGGVRFGQTDNTGSLHDLGVMYSELPLQMDGAMDFAGLSKQAATAAAVFIQRSRGYSTRQAISIEMLEKAIQVIRQANPQALILVDNCYCEFVAVKEPCMVGADLCMGSLIKNPGGGLAATGGYIAGRSDLVALAAQRLTAPGIGGECGSSLGQNRLLYQGLYMAPHTVAQALKTVTFAAAMMAASGYRADPVFDAPRADIIQMLHFGEAEKLLTFCQGIQSGSPVDAFARPEPGDMPGYDCPVVMAAGTFIQGGSVELSCDAPMREPYTAFLQGGLTYEAGKYGILHALEAMAGTAAVTTKDCKDIGLDAVKARL